MIVKCIEKHHVTFKIKPCKVGVRKNLTVKVAIIIFPTTKPRKDVIAIDVFIFQSFMPFLKTTSSTLRVNATACFECDVLLVNFLLNQRSNVWYKDLVKGNSKHKPAFLIVCHTKVT